MSSYSCTKPCTLRPLLAGPVIGVNLLASSASKTLTCSNSSGLLNTAASVNSSTSNSSSTSLPPLACSSCILGTSSCASWNNCLACACVIPAACSSCALAKDIISPNPALLASPPICETAILLFNISSPNSGLIAEANIASSVNSMS